MAIPLLICDDSMMARKQVARALPEGWEVDVTYARNGVEALEAIRAGKGEMVFLDLTMPILDGFGVLEAISKENLKALVVVISGDVQPIAKRRVTRLGALDFIQKPVDKLVLNELLKVYGLI